MIKEGYIPFKGYQTYYRIVGAEYKKTPLLLIHGGPGSTHNHFEVLDELADLDQRPLIMYDQIGCGLSYVRGKHPELFNKAVWCEEIETLRQELRLKELNLLGHSWGGMLAIIYKTDCHPEGIKSITLSSTLSSVSLWEKETHRLIGLLDEKDQKILLEAEKTQNYSTKEYKKAYRNYVIAFIGKKFPKSLGKPECFKRKKKTGENAYLEAWGPSEFKPTGNLHDYEYTDKLQTIDCPVLVCSGINDESTPLQNQIMFDALKTRKQRILYEHSRHMSFFEEKGLYMANLKEFLDSCD